ncbi:MAG TPA: hypothetical protein VGM37_03070 [Armatimonadota bacterium]
MSPGHHDARSPDEIIVLALAEGNYEARWQLVSALQVRTDREAFEAARRLCEAPSAKERALGRTFLASSDWMTIPSTTSAWRP